MFTPVSITQTFGAESGRATMTKVIDPAMVASPPMTVSMVSSLQLPSSIEARLALTLVLSMQQRLIDDLIALADVTGQRIGLFREEGESNSSFLGRLLEAIVERPEENRDLLAPRRVQIATGLPTNVLLSTLRTPARAEAARLAISLEMNRNRDTAAGRVVLLYKQDGQQFASTPRSTILQEPNANYPAATAVQPRLVAQSVPKDQASADPVLSEYGGVASELVAARPGVSAGVATAKVKVALEGSFGPTSKQYGCPPRVSLDERLKSVDSGGGEALPEAADGKIRSTPAEIARSIAAAAPDRPVGLGSAAASPVLQRAFPGEPDTGQALFLALSSLLDGLARSLSADIGDADSRPDAVARLLRHALDSAGYSSTGAEVPDLSRHGIAVKSSAVQESATLAPLSAEPAGPDAEGVPPVVRRAKDTSMAALAALTEGQADTRVTTAPRDGMVFSFPVYYATEDDTDYTERRAKRGRDGEHSDGDESPREDMSDDRRGSGSATRRDGDEADDDEEGEVANATAPGAAETPGGGETVLAHYLSMSSLV